MRGTSGGGVSLLSVAVVVAAWSLVTLTGWVTVVPSPAVLADTLWQLLQSGYSGVSLYRHILASVLRAMSGLSAGIVAGVTIGLAMGLSPVVNAMLTPLFSFLRPIPMIAFIPLFVSYFGIGELPKLIVIFLASFWYVALNSTGGVQTIPGDWLRVAENFGIGGWRLMREVLFPAALPSIIIGIRTAAVVSWAVVVTAELVAAQSGLGYMIEDASTFYNLPVVYIGIGIIGLIGVALERGITLAERRVLHWAGR